MPRGLVLGCESLSREAAVDKQVLRVALLATVLTTMLPSGSKAESWGNALFSEQGHDFGPIARGAIGRHSFVLTNRLDEAITIVDIHASCGCTGGKASATSVAPGQRAFVEAEMDTRNFVGRKETTLFVTIATASGREAEVRLA